MRVAPVLPLLALLLTGSTGHAQETCREIGRTRANDNSDAVILRECRSPLAAANSDQSIAAATPAPAEDSSWQPGPANDPDTCKELWEKVGLPRHAGDDGDSELVAVCHQRYVLLHNNITRIPDWVLERLTAEQVSGAGSRPKVKFRPEPAIPTTARAVDQDYVKSGFARGHQAPSEDFNVNEALMTDSFFFSNVVPQVGNGFNSGIWSTLEAQVRKLAKARGEIYVITGPIYQDPQGRPQKITQAENLCRNVISLDPPSGQARKKVVCAASNRTSGGAPCDGAGAAVPAGLFKIIYDSANQRANAYVLPNIDHRELQDETRPLEYLEKFRTTVHVVEEYTGLRFLTAFSERDQRVRKEECVPTMQH